MYKIVIQIDIPYFVSYYKMFPTRTVHVIHFSVYVHVIALNELSIVPLIITVCLRSYNLCCSY